MIAILYPMARRPDFTNGMTQAWNQIFNDFDNGIPSPTPYTTVLRASLRIYSDHPILRPIAERHGLISKSAPPVRPQVPEPSPTENTEPTQQDAATSPAGCHVAMAMRYYEYLSSAKVDMLFPQIDRSSKAVNTEFGVNASVLKISRNTEGQNPPSVYEKLAAVEDWIYAHEPVGTVDEPTAWIYGRMRLGMTVVPKDWKRRASRTELPLDGTVLFAGDSGDGACILIGGSARHLHDPHAMPAVDMQSGRVGSNASALGILLRSYPDFDDPLLSERFAAQPSQDRYWLIARPATDILLAAAGDGHSSTGIDAVDGEFEFLAKRLQTAVSGKRTASLATPLFLARVD
jgi:hypothetical protein